jgi:hypothetical protein
MIPSRRFLFALCAASVFGACAADASQTYDGSAIAAVFEPTFPEIQANVFTPSCALSFCHGAAMQAMLDLREGASYDHLVGIPSVEVPDHVRVEPFKPDDSYLICKLENCSWIVGSQMPLIGGPLGQEVIDIIRQWITDGALEFPPVAVEGGSWGRVKALYRE